MSYLDYDLSTNNAAPLELYRFVYNDREFLYCTLDGGVSSFTHLGKVYQAEQIFRPSTEMSEDIQKTTLDINVLRTNDLVELFFLGPPEGVVTLTVSRLHLTDTEYNYVAVYKGRVVSASINGDETVLHCEPVFSSLRRPGLRVVYETQCVHGLYQPGCNLIRDDWAVHGFVLDAVATAVIVQQASEKPDGWYKGGVFVSGEVRRMILEHTGVNLTLLHPVRDTVIGQDCTIYPGCNHTLSDCHTKFNNSANALLFAWMPPKNPFTGDNIFW